MATAEVHPARDVFQPTDSNNGDELQTEPNATGRRFPFRVKSKIENEMDEESTSVATLGRKGVEKGKEATARESIFLKRLVIALMIMVFLLSVIGLSLVIVLVKAKSGESDETGNQTQQASAEKLQGTFLDTEALTRLNNLEENMKSLKQNLEEKTKDIILPRCFLRYFDTKCKESEELALKIQNISQRLDASVSAINVSFFQELLSENTSFDSKIRNISQRLDASVSAINVSFFQELSSVKTSFDSKLNNTARNLLHADNSLQTLLSTINSTLSSQVQSISKLQGPTGPSGFNGSKGDQGPPGGSGAQGNQGAQGVKGDPGVKGDRGVNGTDGAAGQKGDTGPKGDKGDTGAAGPQGVKGETGPQGPQGAGNFSQCIYKEFQGTGVAPGPNESADASIVEAANKKILGVSCSTNNAAEYNLVKTTDGPLNKYICNCRGESLLFVNSPMWCKIHYWECPLTT